LAKRLPLISGSPTESNKPKLYLLNNRINKFDKVIDVSGGTEWGFGIQKTFPQYAIFVVDGGDIGGNYNSWAIVDGETNELLIGCNKAITNSDNIFKDDGSNTLNIFIKHDIFKDKINN
jgi:hypothetical protein